MSKKYIRIIAIGDIHGRTNWSQIVKDNYQEDSLYIFLGDYLDPYEEYDPYELVDNLQAIIDFKKEHQDNVILLLGNHDMHYINEDIPIGTRFDNLFAENYRNVFLQNSECFQYAFQLGNIVFSHAGISNFWFTNDFKGDPEVNIAQQLNHPTPDQLKAMFQVGCYRGGDSRCAGIFWADMNETRCDPLMGYHQVVGHTQVNGVTTYRVSEDTKITYCDCLMHNQVYTIEL